MIVRVYRPRDTANTEVDICLLVENGNKQKNETKFAQTFFYQPFGCTKANFGPLTRRKRYSLEVNHKIISNTTRGPPGTL